MAERELNISDLRKWFVIESSVLGGERVLVVSDRRHLEEARAANPDLVIYYPHEVRELLTRGVAPMLCRRIHMIKKVLDGEIVPTGKRVRT